MYLDHAATTPLGPEAREAMRPWLEGHFGNPSSVHAAGREAREAVESARETVAGCIGAQREEIVFTSGGTEADNLALSLPGHLAVSAIEHPAVLEPAKKRKAGLLDVDGEGRVVGKPSGADLVAVMLVNNEVGTVQRFPKRDYLLHMDAVQAAGKIPVDVKALGCDLLTLSSHKVNGPQGVGALFVRKGVELPPLLLGGGQEGGLRSGTENVAGIVGFAAALKAAGPGDSERLRDRLERLLKNSVPGLRVNAGGAERAPHILSVSIDGIDGEAALVRLDREGISASSGSACSSEDFQPSHVLSAMGVSRLQAKGTLRFSLGKGNTEAEIDKAAAAVARVVKELRAIFTAL